MCKGHFLTACVGLLLSWHYYGLSVATEPGFLDFDNLPETNFSCEGKVIGGYYADTETGCQMFHVCTIGQKSEVTDIKFLCLNGTVFDQETRVCERLDEVDCSKSESFYDLNLELYGNQAAFGIQPENEDVREENLCEDEDDEECNTEKPEAPAKPNPTEQVQEEELEEEDVTTQPPLPSSTTPRRPAVTSTSFPSTTATPQIVQLPSSSPETIAALLALHKAFTESLQQHSNKDSKVNPPKLTGFVESPSPDKATQQVETFEIKAGQTFATPYPHKTQTQFNVPRSPQPPPPPPQFQSPPKLYQTPPKPQFQTQKPPQQFQSPPKPQFQSQPRPPFSSPPKQQYQIQPKPPSQSISVPKPTTYTTSERFGNGPFHHSFHINSQVNHYQEPNYNDQYADHEQQPSSQPQTEAPKQYDFNDYDDDYYDEKPTSSTITPYLLHQIKVNQLHHSNQAKASSTNHGSFVREVSSPSPSKPFNIPSFRSVTPGIAIITATSTTSSSSVKTGKPGQSAIQTHKEVPTAAGFIESLLHDSNNTRQQLPDPPQSYDDYREGDVRSDPFYKDVPKIGRSKRSLEDNVVDFVDPAKLTKLKDKLINSLFSSNSDTILHAILDQYCVDQIDSSDSLFSYCNFVRRSNISDSRQLLGDNWKVVIPKDNGDYIYLVKTIYSSNKYHNSTSNILLLVNLPDEFKLVRDTIIGTLTSEHQSNNLVKALDINSVNSSIHHRFKRVKRNKSQGKSVRSDLATKNGKLNRIKTNPNRRKRQIHSTEVDADFGKISEQQENIQSYTAQRKRGQQQVVVRRKPTRVIESSLELEEPRFPSRMTQQIPTQVTESSLEVEDKISQTRKRQHRPESRKQPSQLYSSIPQSPLQTNKYNHDVSPSISILEEDKSQGKLGAEDKLLGRPSSTRRGQGVKYHFSENIPTEYEEPVDEDGVESSTTYPFNIKPGTQFTCDDKVKGGYYADVEAQCFGYFICSQGEINGPLLKSHFWCGKTTKFNQRSRTCQAESNVVCSVSERYFHLNTDILSLSQNKPDESDSRRRHRSKRSEELTRQTPKQTAQPSLEAEDLRPQRKQRQQRLGSQRQPVQRSSAITRSVLQTKDKETYAIPSPTPIPEEINSQGRLLSAEDKMLGRPSSTRRGQGVKYHFSENIPTEYEEPVEEDGVESSTTYPFNIKPGTQFTCDDKVKGGYYADVEAQCFGYFICSQGEIDGPLLKSHFWCGKTTKFNQRSRTCQAESNVVCSVSERYFHLNTDILSLSQNKPDESDSRRRHRSKRSEELTRQTPKQTAQPSLEAEDLRPQRKQRQQRLGSQRQPVQRSSAITRSVLQTKDKETYAIPSPTPIPEEINSQGRLLSAEDKMLGRPSSTRRGQGVKYHFSENIPTEYEEPVEEDGVESSTTYPFNIKPGTQFTCDDKVKGGYYADVEAQCFGYFICSQGEINGPLLKSHFWCGKTTKFNQRSRTCQAESNVVCSVSERYFHLNTDILSLSQNKPDESDTRRRHRSKRSEELTRQTPKQTAQPSLEAEDLRPQRKQRQQRLESQRQPIQRSSAITRSVLQTKDKETYAIPSPTPIPEEINSQGRLLSAEDKMLGRPSSTRRGQGVKYHFSENIPTEYEEPVEEDGVESSTTYPFNIKPGTQFTCDDKVKGGYYADVEAQCFGYFICSQGEINGPLLKSHFWCGKTTKFNQRSRTCQAESNVVCSVSERYFHLNTDILSLSQNKPDESDTRRRHRSKRSEDVALTSNSPKSHSKSSRVKKVFRSKKWKQLIARKRRQVDVTEYDFDSRLTSNNNRRIRPSSKARGQVQVDVRRRPVEYVEPSLEFDKPRPQSSSREQVSRKQPITHNHTRNQPLNNEGTQQFLTQTSSSELTEPFDFLEPRPQSRRGNSPARRNQLKLKTHPRNQEYYEETTRFSKNPKPSLGLIANEKSSVRVSNKNLESHLTRKEKGEGAISENQQKQQVPHQPSEEVYDEVEVSTTYPFNIHPGSKFTCEGKIKGGYYADVEAECYGYFICSQGKVNGPLMKSHFWCGPATKFNQRSRTCQAVANVVCGMSERYFHINKDILSLPDPDDVIIDSFEPSKVLS